MRPVLLAPTEGGYDPTDVKQALLTFDRVTLLAPNDRDLFPPSSYMAAIGVPMMSASQPVRPLGKTQDYDAKFQLLTEELQPFLREGVLEVVSSWDQSQVPPANAFVIGNPGDGGFPLNPAGLLEDYRALASDQEMLEASIKDYAAHGVDASTLSVITSDGVADHGFEVMRPDGKFTAQPLPLLTSKLDDEALRQPLTRLSRARLATALKVWALALTNGGVPVLPPASAAALDLLNQRSSAALDSVCQQDSFWARRGAVLDVCFTEIFDRQRLAEIEPELLLHYRSRNMALAAEQREKFMLSLDAMAGEDTNLDLAAYKEKVRERAREFLKSLKGLRDERAKLGWDITLEAGKGIAGSGTVGGIAHVFTPLSLEAAIAAAVLWGFHTAQSRSGKVYDLFRSVEDIKATSSFAVFRRFDQLTSF